MGVNDIHHIFIYWKGHAWLTAFSILAFYLLLAKISDLIIVRFLKKLVAKTSIAFDDYLIKYIHRPIVITIILLGPLHALQLFAFNNKISFVLEGIIKNLILIVWWIGAFQIIQWFTKRKLPSLETQGHLAKDLVVLIKNLLFISLGIIGFVAFLLIWHINLAPFLASAGIAGIALALAAKETLANFFGGISIFLDRTYKVGDYIILDSGERGEIVDVGIRSTRIRTRDDVLITIPNSIMANSKIINESAPQPRFRLRMPVGVAYGSDLNKVEDILLTLVQNIPHVVSEPNPRVRFRCFEDSCIKLELLCWVDDPRHKGPVTHELIKQIHKEFAREEIVIPFPQRDVHLYPKEK